MDNKRDPSPTLEDTNGSGDSNALKKMRAFMEEPHHQNHTLEDNVHNIKQRQQESNPQRRRK